jgi:hypothetical protein
MRLNQARQAELSVKLAEYQVGSTRADFHTNLIWTWAIAIVGFNAAGVGILAQAEHFQDRFLLVSLLAAAATFLVSWWNLAADRWHVLIHVWYVRLQEIETDLGMHLNRHIGVRDRDALSTNDSDAIIRTRLRNETGYPSVGAVGPKKLRALLQVGVPAIWALVMLEEAFASVTGGRTCIALSVSDACKRLEWISYSDAGIRWILGLIPMGAVWCFLTRPPCRKKLEATWQKANKTVLW